MADKATVFEVSVLRVAVLEEEKDGLARGQESAALQGCLQRKHQGRGGPQSGAQGKWLSRQKAVLEVWFGSPNSLPMPVGTFFLSPSSSSCSETPQDLPGVQGRVPGVRLSPPAALLGASWASRQAYCRLGGWGAVEDGALWAGGK